MSTELTISRSARKPIPVPSGVDFNFTAGKVLIKGAKGSLEQVFHPTVVCELKESGIHIRSQGDYDEATKRAQTGTAHAIIRNMLKGVTQNFERKLVLTGVGYRAKAQGDKLQLTLGFSHTVEYRLPKGVMVETPSQTEIVVRGIDKQLVGQVAAEIREFRPPEPYKGKGTRYEDEQIQRKEAKKK